MATYVLDLETSTDRERAKQLKRSELIFEEGITFTAAMMYAPVSADKPEVTEFYGKDNAEEAILNLPAGRYYTWNGAKFDMHFIYHLLRRASYVKQEVSKSKQSRKKQLKPGEFNYLLVGSRLISLTFRNHYGVVEIRDACLLFTCSLNTFINNTAPEFPKLVDTYDYEKFRLFDSDFTETDKDYCRHDIYGFSVGLHRIIADFEKAFDMDISDSFTAGSFAMKYSKRKLDERHIKSVNENENFNGTGKPFPPIPELFPNVNFDRKFVMGGRTFLNIDYEGLIFGDERTNKYLTKVDANSFYPSIMVNTKLPYGKQKRIRMKGEDLDKFLESNPEKYVFAHLISGVCRYDDKFSPIIINDGSIRDYPTNAGSADKVYLDDNVLRDEKFYHHKAIFDCYIFEGCVGIMKYMSDVFDLKNLYKFEEKYGLELTVKIILNATYGKFIQRDKMPEYDFLDGIIEPTGALSQLDSWHLYPPFGAAITANARYELTKYMNILGERFIYCDTDSLVFWGDVPKEIPLGYKLGEWKVEASPEGVWNAEKKKMVNVTGKGVFFQRKTYAVETDGETKITFCGISDKAVEKAFPEGVTIDDLHTAMLEEISFDVLQGNRTLDGIVLIERNRIKKFVPRL